MLDACVCLAQSVGFLPSFISNLLSQSSKTQACQGCSCLKLPCYRIDPDNYQDVDLAKTATEHDWGSMRPDQTHGVKLLHTVALNAPLTQSEAKCAKSEALFQCEPGVKLRSPRHPTSIRKSSGSPAQSLEGPQNAAVSLQPASLRERAPITTKDTAITQRPRRVKCSKKMMALSLQPPTFNQFQKPSP